MQEFSTADPKPAGKIKIDGVEHDVWNGQDIGLDAVEAFIGAQDDLAKLADQKDIRAKAKVMGMLVLATVPTVERAVVERIAAKFPLRMIELFNKVMTTISEGDPFVIAALAKARASAATKPPGKSTTTRSGRSSRAPSAGATEKSSV